MTKLYTAADLDILCSLFRECAEYHALISLWVRTTGAKFSPSGDSLVDGTKIVDTWQSLTPADKDRASQDGLTGLFRHLLIRGVGLITDIVMLQATFAKAKSGDLQFCIDLLRPCMHSLNGMSNVPLLLEVVCEQIYDQVVSPSFVSGNSSVCCEMSEI